MNGNIFSTKGAKQNRYSVERAPKFRIGERVFNHDFEKGVVRGVHPNGMLLVRYDGHTSDRPVFPTFLGKFSAVAKEVSP